MSNYNNERLIELEARLAGAEALLREAREDWLQEREWIGGTENGCWRPVGATLLAFIRKVDGFLAADSASVEGEK